MTLLARWWTPINRKATAFSGQAGQELEVPGDAGAQCRLCFHACLIPPGGTGYCRARTYDGHTLHSPYLGQFCSAAVDPVEKKPLRHWRPGTAIYSLGSLGCTMRCPFCQNHSIAQPDFSPSGRLPRLAALAVDKLAATVREHGLRAVAYTYNEPGLQAEYILEAAPVLQEAGVASVLVSNGMLADEPLRELAPFIAAANIDVKCFNTTTYASMGGSLERVKATVAFLLEAGTHVEVTHLLVPGLSDSPEEFTAMTEWLASLSPGIPLHISRYFPACRYRREPTPLPLLKAFKSIADLRLHHVHIGNV